MKLVKSMSIIRIIMQNPKDLPDLFVIDTHVLGFCFSIAHCHEYVNVFSSTVRSFPILEFD